MPVSSIEFIFDSDCPNVSATRENLRAALKTAGLPLRWQEWNRADAKAPAHVKRYGSPTVLIDGHDVAGVEPADAPSCRIYSGETGQGRGVLSVEMILKALQQKPAGAPSKGRGSVVAALPAIGVAMLPKLTCAACWPAYAALLGAMGVNFVDYTPYLLPAVIALLLVTLAFIGWRANRRRGYLPLGLGVMASAIILLGKFAFDADMAAYTGGALLIAASAWNAWPLPRQTESSCPACATPANAGPGRISTL